MKDVLKRGSSHSAESDAGMLMREGRRSGSQDGERLRLQDLCEL
jgi:hypothetical protein